MGTKKQSRGKENVYPKKSSKHDIPSFSFQNSLSNSNSNSISKPNAAIYEKNGSRRGSQAKVIVKYDAGFKNTLFVRGQGANLSWDKGVPLKNVKADEWIWEPETSFADCEFKILINDVSYEEGENHRLRKGMKIQFTPHFS